MKLETWQRNLYAITLSQFIGLSGTNLIFPFIPFYIQELGISGAGATAFWTGVMGTASGLALFVSSPLWGALADRFGRKPMLIRAYFAAAIFMGLQGLAQNVWQLLALRILQGFFVGTVPAAAALVASGTPPRQLGYSMGLLQIGVFSSGFIGPLVGGLLASSVGFRETFFITSCFHLLSGVFVLLAVKERFTRPEPAHRESLFSGIRLVSTNSALLLLVVIVFFLNVSPAFTRPIIPLLIQGFSETIDATRDSGIVFAAIALTSTATALAVAQLSHRIGYKRVLALSAVGVGLAYMPVAMANNVLALVVLLAIVGLFAGAGLPSANALIGMFTPPGKQGIAFGVSGSAMALAMAVGPVMGGSIASWLGIHAGFPVIGVVMIAVGLLVLMFVREPSKEPQPVEERAPAPASPAS